MEVIRLWIKHMQALWEERDRQKQREEMGLLEFLQMIEAQQRMLRTVTKALADEPDSPRRRQALVTAESSQRTLAEEIEPLQEKIKAALQPPQQPAQPDQPAAGPRSAPSISPEAAEKAVQLLSDLADDARRAMVTAGDRLHGGSATEAVESQTEVIEQLDQIYRKVAPFADLVGRAIDAQQGLIDQVAPVVENPDEQEPLDFDESAWNQRFVAGWSDQLTTDARSFLQNPQTIRNMAVTTLRESDPQAAPPNREEVKKLVEAIRQSLEKAVELGPKVKTLTDEAATHLQEAKPAEALPKQEEALKLLKEIADPLPKQDQQQQGEQQKDEQEKDRQQDQQESEEGQNEKQQPRKPQDLSIQQAEAVLRKARERAGATGSLSASAVRSTGGRATRATLRARLRIGVVAILFVLLGCAGCSPSVDLEVARAFQEAQKTFDEADSPEDFLRAAGLYQSILDRGVVSGVVLYNQGNAYMRAGRRGRAIAAYRQAQRYRPRDPYLESNLSFALGTENPAGRRRPVVEYLLFWQDWLSYPEKARLTAAAAVVTFVLAVAGLFWHRRLLTRLAIGVLALTLLLAFSTGYDWYRYDYVVHGVVVQDEVIARKGNAASYEPAFTEALTEGTEFRLVEARGDWLLIRLPGGQEGWVERGAVVVY